MLTDKQLEKYADVLLWGLQTARTNKFRKNDIILLRYDFDALKLAEILYSKLIQMGINPIQRMVSTPNMEKSFFQYSNEKQLSFIGPGEEEFFYNLNGNIYLMAPSSITHLSDVDPTKIGKNATARKYLRDILNKREENGDFSWTLCILPTQELADHAGLTLQEYSKQIAAACFLNKKSPVNEWKNVFNQAMEIKKWLNSLDIKHYHVESQNTDLKVGHGKYRKWIGISGHNIPSFELFLSPDWRETQGIYFANQPSYRNGNYVKNIRLEFDKGIAVKIEAEQGEEFIQKQLKIDPGANRLGEFSLTDKKFSKINKFMANTLFDENYGGKYGNCHVALGASYSDTYDGDPTELTKDKKKELGFNDSALHWDIINTEKKSVTAKLKSGENIIIYDNGEFKY